MGRGGGGAGGDREGLKGVDREGLEEAVDGIVELGAREAKFRLIVQR